MVATTWNVVFDYRSKWGKEDGGRHAKRNGSWYRFDFSLDIFVSQEGELEVEIYTTI